MLLFGELAESPEEGNHWSAEALMLAGPFKREKFETKPNNKKIKNQKKVYERVQKQ